MSKAIDTTGVVNNTYNRLCQIAEKYPSCVYKVRDYLSSKAESCKSRTGNSKVSLDIIRMWIHLSSTQIDPANEIIDRSALRNLYEHWPNIHQYMERIFETYPCN
jgi:hypothetical protein